MQIYLLALCKLRQPRKQKEFIFQTSVARWRVLERSLIICCNCCPLSNSCEMLRKINDQNFYLSNNAACLLHPPNWPIIVQICECFHSIRAHKHTFPHGTKNIYLEYLHYSIYNIYIIVSRISTISSVLFPLLSTLFSLDNVDFKYCNGPIYSWQILLRTFLAVMTGKK